MALFRCEFFGRTEAVSKPRAQLRTPFRSNRTLIYSELLAALRFPHFIGTDHCVDFLIRVNNKIGKLPLLIKETTAWHFSESSE